MDIRTKTHQIQAAVDSDNFINRISNHSTHVCRHKDVDDIAYLERTFHDVRVNSVFHNHIDLDQLLGDMIYYKAQDIAKWMETANNYDKQAFHVFFDKDDYGPIGTGLIHDKSTNLIREYTSNDVYVVLRKDPENSLGFSLVTAYPNMDSPNIAPTNRNLKEITMLTPTYQKASPTEKAYLLYRTSYQSQASISYSPGCKFKEDDVLYIHLPTENPNTKHVIKIKEHQCTLKTVHTNEITGERETLMTKYTQIRDQHDDKHRQPSVSLLEPHVRQEFAKDYPNIDKDITYLQRKIHDCKPKMTREQRVAKTVGLIKDVTHSNDMKYER